MTCRLHLSVDDREMCLKRNNAIRSRDDDLATRCRTLPVAINQRAIYETRAILTPVIRGFPRALSARRRSIDSLASKFLFLVEVTDF